MTQCERLRQWLEKHGEIDSATARRELGIERLAARVYDLRRMGMVIATYPKRVRNRFGEICEIALYRLEKSDADV